MKKFRRLLCLPLIAALCLGLMVPLPAQAADIYFTSVNDRLLPLTSDTMPTWSEGVLYVPYTVFDSRATEANLGLSSSYSKGENQVTIYKLRQFLQFDLNNGTCQDGITGESYQAHAIMRNGIPYVPVGTVCRFFDLEYSYTTIAQGYLVRIKNDAVILSDSKFIDGASNLINRRLREYNQSIAPAPETDPTPVTPTPSVTEEEDPSDVRVYLAFRCQEREGLEEILDALDDAGVCALFLMTPQLLEEESALVRRMLASGHSVGLLAEGDSLEETRQLLSRGNALLEGTLCLRTTIACVPKDQRSALEEEGWVCWSETMALAPTATVGVNTFAANTLNRLEKRTWDTFVTMEGDANAARVLPTLLRQLRNSHYVVSIPLETRL